MKRIDRFREEDVPEAAALFVKVFGCTEGRTSGEFRDYFRRLHFGNPRYDPERGSLVHRGSDGRISGFIGGYPLTMRHRGRILQGVAAGSYMVDPDARDAFAAARLIRALIDRGHDLIVSDSANDVSRRIWTRLGVATDRLLSMGWARPLRPLRFSHAVWQKRRRVGGRAHRALSALLGIADLPVAAVLGRRSGSSSEGVEPRELTAEAMAEHSCEMWPSRALMPGHDTRYLEWLLIALSEKTRYGPLRKVALYERGGSLLGWYLYYPNRGAIGQVVQVAARPGAYARVLRHLFRDATEQGSSGLVGRVDPQRTKELSDAHCVLFQRDTWTVTHARDRSVRHALMAHDVVLSRMEGDWWTRLSGG